MKKALVTGGSGFLGRAIVEMLLEKGVEVNILCRKNFEDLEKKGCKIFKGEISNQELVTEACKDCDIVFHTAAKAGVDGPYSEYLRINYDGTICVLNACKANKVSKLVYTSTPSVVFAEGDICGGDESLPYPSDHSASYPKTKTMAEKAVLEANSKELATTALRPHLMWGPGDNNLVPRLVSRAKSGGLKFIGDGQNVVDTTFITNAAKAHILAAEALEYGKAPAGKAYFITNGEPLPIMDITNKLIACAGCAPVTKTIPYKVAYVAGFILENVYKLFRLKGEPKVTRWVAGEMSKSHWFNISAAKRDFGYEPEIKIEEGLKILTEHFKSHSK